MTAERRPRCKVRGSRVERVTLLTLTADLAPSRQAGGVPEGVRDTRGTLRATGARLPTGTRRTRVVLGSRRARLTVRFLEAVPLAGAALPLHYRSEDCN